MLPSRATWTFLSATATQINNDRGLEHFSIRHMLRLQKCVSANVYRGCVAVADKNGI
jgi:hypothetical protein